MGTATASFVTGTILLLAIVAALATGLGVAALVTMVGGEACASTAGVAAFFATMVATLIIDDRRVRN
jgi:hypothetical protein